MARPVGTVTGRSTIVCGPACHSSPRTRTARTRPQPRPGPAKPRYCSRPPRPAYGPVDLGRSFRSYGRPRESHDQNRDSSGSHQTLTSFLSPLSLSLPFFSTQQAQLRASKGGGVRQPWHRRRPPCRHACSQMGEHAAVERPGRGAPLAEPGEQLPPARPFFSRADEGPSRHMTR